MKCYRCEEWCVCMTVQHDAGQAVPSGMCQRRAGDWLPALKPIRDLAEAATCAAARTLYRPQSTGGPAHQCRSPEVAGGGHLAVRRWRHHWHHGKWVVGIVGCMLESCCHAHVLCIDNTLVSILVLTFLPKFFLLMPCTCLYLIGHSVTLYIIINPNP